MADTRVHPSKPIAEETVKLSICDVYSPKVWVTQTHYWPLDDQISFERAHDILKEALSRTLTEIPALAGTISRLSGDPRDLCIRVDGDAHVELASEDFTSKDFPSYSEIKSAGFPMTTELCAAFSQPITLMPVVEGARMLAAKLNQLKGGLALSFGFNHLLADAGTVAEVERIWACHANDVSLGQAGSHRPSIPDHKLRERLSTPVPDAVAFEDENWKVFPVAASQLNLPREAVAKEAALTVLEQTKKAHLAALNGEIEETKWCLWKFSAQNLAQLKKDATGPDASQWISTMDALVALFWSRLAYAKQKSKEGYASSLVLFPINIRQRLQPPIEAQYLGNAVDIVTTKCPLLELEAEDTGLVTAAQYFRTAVSGWKESKWAAWLNMATKLPADEAICPNPLALLATHNMGFNDYSKSQSNQLNWGPELGAIDRTRYMKPASSLANCATAVIVHPRLADGGLEVATTSNTAIRMALEKDLLFQKYGSFVCEYA